MKNLLNLSMVLAILLISASCTNELIEQEDMNLEAERITSCSSQNPKARITNNGSDDVDLEIFDESGTLLGAAYDVEPGTVSSWKSFSAGVIEFKISTAISVKSIVIDMGTCTGYDVTIDANNHLDTDQPIGF
ncbi:MAG: hypothetical protein HKN90_05570 [Flavobacteriaceae bacterium]|nr:hypothetical protein [Flavobacteriaceae bacterium]